MVDATGKTLGRLATQIANVLKGKHKPIYTPSMDCGDFVIVVNAEKIKATGRKLDEKFYYRYSGYPSGLSAISLRDQLKIAPRAGDPGRRVGHAQPQPPAPPVDEEAEGLRRAAASARGPAAEAFPACVEEIL